MSDAPPRPSCRRHGFGTLVGSQPPHQSKNGRRRRLLLRRLEGFRHCRNTYLQLAFDFSRLYGKELPRMVCRAIRISWLAADVAFHTFFLLYF